jgi:hypothetical protein
MKGQKWQAHKRLIMMPRRVGRQQMWFMIGGLHKGRGMTMGWNSHIMNDIDLALPSDA